MSALGPRQFAETAALYAILEEDYVEARRIVEDMNWHELRTFEAQVGQLADLIADALQSGT